MLKSVGKASTYEEMYTEIKENINFASAESKVVSADQVRKLVGVLERLQAAKVYPLMKSYQAVSQQKTWVSRRTIVTRLPVYTSSEAELRYLANIQRTPWCLTSITNFAVV